jgi:predicted nucleic acid-binding protein
MRIVLDTSAAIDIVLQLPGSGILQKKIEEAEWIESPDLMIAEAANVCWKRYRSGAMNLEACETLLAETLNLPDHFISGSELHEEAFALAVASQRPVYDMFFVALARRRNALLLTSDKGLRSFAADLKIKTL